MAVVRSPLLHFLALGALLLVSLQWAQGSPAPPPPPPVRISAAELDAWAAAFARREGRPPDRTERAGWLAGRVDEELLVREARARGFQRDDPVVRARLERNLHFLGGDRLGGELGGDALGGDAEIEDAYALGLDESDPVVRRRLAQRMRELITAPARAREPSEADLARLAAAHPEPSEPVLRITQIFFSRERRGEAALRDAQRMRSRLVARGLGPEAALEEFHGDPLLWAAELPPLSPSGLAARFGPTFAEAVADEELGVWSRPLSSSYGVHLVWVHERREVPPDEAGRRARLRARFFEEREAEALHDALAELRRDVPVEVVSSARETVGTEDRGE